MVRKLVYLYLLFVTVTVSAQSPNGSWTKPNETFGRNFTNVLKCSDNSILYEQTYGDRISRIFNILEFDFVNQKMLCTIIDAGSFKAKDSLNSPIALVYEDGKAYAITNGYSFKQELYFSIYELSLCEEDDVNRIHTATGSNREQFYSIPWASNVNMGKTKVAKSHDKSKTLIFIEHPINKKSATSAFGFCLFNGKELVATQTINLDFPPRKLNSFNVWVDDNGNVLLKSEYKKDKEKRIEYSFLETGSNLFEPIDINLGDSTEIVDIQFIFHPTIGSLITGTFKDKKRENARGANGIFSYKLQDASNNRLGKQDFTDELFTEYYNLDGTSEPISGIISSNLKDVIQLPNGDAIYLIEAKTTTMNYVGPTGATREKYFNRFGDVLISYVDMKENKIKWTHILRKNQKTERYDRYTGDLSVIPLVVKDKLIVLYNNTEIVNKNPDTAINEYLGFPVFMMILDFEGESLSSNKRQGDRISFGVKHGGTKMYLFNNLVSYFNNDTIGLLSIDRNKEHFAIGKFSF